MAEIRDPHPPRVSTTACFGDWRCPTKRGEAVTQGKDLGSPQITPTTSCLGPLGILLCKSSTKSLLRIILGRFLWNVSPYGRSETRKEAGTEEGEGARVFFCVLLTRLLTLRLGT